MIAKMILVTGVTCTQVIGPSIPPLYGSRFFSKVSVEPDFVVAKDQARLALSVSTSLLISMTIRTTLTNSQH